MLPVVHKYDMHGLLGQCMSVLEASFPLQLSVQRANPGYILTWLQLADDLQLYGLKDKCIARLATLTGVPGALRQMFAPERAHAAASTSAAAATATAAAAAAAGAAGSSKRRRTSAAGGSSNSGRQAAVLVPPLSVTVKDELSQLGQCTLVDVVLAMCKNSGDPKCSLHCHCLVSACYPPQRCCQRCTLPSRSARCAGCGFCKICDGECDLYISSDDLDSLIEDLSSSEGETTDDDDMDSDDTSGSEEE